MEVLDETVGVIEDVGRESLNRAQCHRSRGGEERVWCRVMPKVDDRRSHP